MAKAQSRTMAAEISEKEELVIDVESIQKALVRNNNSMAAELDKKYDDLQGKTGNVVEKMLIKEDRWESFMNDHMSLFKSIAAEYDFTKFIVTPSKSTGSHYMSIIAPELNKAVKVRFSGHKSKTALENLWISKKPSENAAELRKILERVIGKDGKEKKV